MAHTGLPGGGRHLRIPERSRCRLGASCGASEPARGYPQADHFFRFQPGETLATVAGSLPPARGAALLRKALAALPAVGAASQRVGSGARLLYYYTAIH
jgi:hypothetical protein